jgi:hypothetical protein
MANASLKLTGDRALSQPFARALAGVLATADSRTSPAAMSLLLVATGMLVAPLALLAHQAPQIVRILTDLLP